MQDVMTFLGHHPLLLSAIAIVAFLLFILEARRLRKAMTGVTPQAAIDLMSHQQAVVIDIRDQATFKKGHIVHAQNITRDTILNDKKILKLKSKPLIIVCAAGISAQTITHELNKKGFMAHTLQGGMKAWYDAKLPLVSEAHHD